MDGDLTGAARRRSGRRRPRAVARGAARPAIYVNARQRPRTTSSFSVIVRGPDRAPWRSRCAGSCVKSAGLARAVDGDAGLARGGSRRFNLWLISAFAAAALGLAMLARLRPGRLCGLAAIARDGHPRGAGRRAVRRWCGWCSRQAAWLTGLGAAAGLGLALLASGAVPACSLASPPYVLLSVAAIMLASALAASYVPARRIASRRRATPCETRSLRAASQELPDQPPVAGRVDDRALQQRAADRARTFGVVFVLADRSFSRCHAARGVARREPPPRPPPRTADRRR